MRLACKNEKLAKMVEDKEELEKKVGDRVIANKNASNLFQDRIDQLEQQMSVKEKAVDAIDQDNEKLRISIRSKEQSQAKLNSELEQKCANYEFLQKEANLKQNMLT